MINNRKLLICIPEIPYPVRRNGISIRYLPILKHFSKNYEIDLLLILKDSVNEDDIDKLKIYSKNLYCLVLKKNKPSILKKIFVHLRAFLPRQQPLSIYSYNYEEIKTYILLKTHNIKYDVKLSVTQDYSEFIRKYVTADKYVIDSMDSLYSHMRRSHDGTLLYKYKLSLMRKWELNSISKADIVSYVSSMDAEILTKNANNVENIHIVPNGIYIDDYMDEKMPIEGFVIGFLGNMEYYPNIQAALKLSEIFLCLKKEIVDLKLLIIGRNPSQEILNLKKHSRIIVTGSVDSIWPYVNSTDVFVFPMAYGSGQQNKILDVMYAERPVISTSLGNSGIGAKKYFDIEIADTDTEIKEKILELYYDAEKIEDLAKNGKIFIEKNYGWNNIFKKIESVYLFND